MTAPPSPEKDDHYRHAVASLEKTIDRLRGCTDQERQQLRTEWQQLQEMLKKLTEGRIEIVVFGEISLSGHVRPVGQTETRLKEAQKLGFTEAIVPDRSKSGTVAGLKVQQLPDLATLVGDIFGAG